jgi:phage gp45-like
MRTRTILASLAVFLAGVAVGIAADANIGTWKLNEAKSKIGAGATKNDTVVYAAAGDDVKITVDGINAEGKPVHHEWTGKYDGKDYPVTGDPISDARSYRKIDDRTLEFTAKKGGKATVTGRVVLSADGKSRTVTSSATDAKGKKIESTAVYDKQ